MITQRTDSFAVLHEIKLGSQDSTVSLFQIGIYPWGTLEPTRGTITSETPTAKTDRALRLLLIHQIRLIAGRVIVVANAGVFEAFNAECERLKIAKIANTVIELELLARMSLAEERDQSIDGLSKQFNALEIESIPDRLAILCIRLSQEAQRNGVKLKQYVIHEPDRGV